MNRIFESLREFEWQELTMSDEVDEIMREAEREAERIVKVARNDGYDATCDDFTSAIFTLMFDSYIEGTECDVSSIEKTIRENVFPSLKRFDFDAYFPPTSDRIIGIRDSDGKVGVFYEDGCFGRHIGEYREISRADIPNGWWDSYEIFDDFDC